MRKIILIRHATAEPERYPLKDFDRNLDGTGMAEAARLGKYLLAKKEVPDAIHYSSSNRTSQTAEILIREAKLDAVVTVPEMDLYNAGYLQLIEQIKYFGADQYSILMIAHNPGISQIATALSQDSYQLSPGSAVCLNFAFDSWSEIRSGSGKENWYFIP
ncbi:MAG TPA: histidine phosphatase family protein [Catalimonadaceae bacterium]|nr:histidine phosphatase family protein [Catalimonadaceae bacterium]